MTPDAVACPPHVFVMDTGKASVIGDGTLENIPRLSKYPTPPLEVLTR